MLRETIVLNSFEQVAVTAVVSVLALCSLTFTQGIQIKDLNSNGSGGPIMHYPSAQVESKGLSHNSSVNPVPPSSNVTGVCLTGPCVTVTGVAAENVDSRLKLNALQAVNTNNSANYSVFPHFDKGSSRKWNPEALLRGSYVFLGLSAVVLAYVLWKSMRKKKTLVHKYGVVPSHEDMELSHLDSEDGDEDTTHFDISTHRVK